MDHAPDKPVDTGGEPGSIRPLHPLRNRMDDVPYWCDDICCCEPEPRWQALAEEIGIDLTARDRHDDASRRSDPGGGA